jgi:hypothetical protein
MQIRGDVYILAAVLSIFASSLHAASLLGVVKDPSGAVIPKAAITLEGPTLTESRDAITDAQGRFRFDDLPPGIYTLHVFCEGFETFEQSVGVVSEKPAELVIMLKLKRSETVIEVTTGQSRLKNSDANYQALRTGKLTEVYRVRNLTLVRDVATLAFRSGSFSPLPAIAGRVAGAVFVGEGTFTLKPASEISTVYLHQIAGIDSVNEEFSSAVLYFSDETFEAIRQHAELALELAKQHQQALEDVQERMRWRVDPPVSLLQILLQDDDVPNLEAEMLAWLYNPAQQGSFRAFIHGRKHSDLRFIVNPLGVLPKLPAPEETALLNVNPAGSADGIWYLSHLARELNDGSASSSEDKRLLAAEHYRMVVTIDTSLRITATCDLRFRVVQAGTRVVKFDLLPDMQVTRVTLDGTEIPYIQESRKKDGSFYIVLPQPLAQAKSHQAVIEYGGSNLIRYAGGSDYFINPRRPWYPRPGAAGRATYDITFRVPRGMMAISVGKLVQKWKDGPADAFRWSSDTPLPAAGFNYGSFWEKQPADSQSAGPSPAYLSKLPDPFRGGPVNLGGPSSRLALDIVGNAMKCFQYWFGPLPYGRPAISQSPAMDSLPGLLFVSGHAMTPYFHRYFPVREMIPAQVARQWWGNLVDPVSFHDAWLSRGFADFATSLYHMAVSSDHPQDFLEHWRLARNAILGQNLQGMNRNDAAPVWLGAMADINSTVMGPDGRVRADTSTSSTISARKGAFVLHMLRCLMLDPASGDKDFISLMHDFVSTFAHRGVSTEDFKAIVEKHMKPSMDLERNGRMDWFFNEWIYRKELPSYRLEYFLEPQPDGTQILQGSLTQSGVPASFVMRIPIYAKLKAKLVKIGAAVIAGSTTGKFQATLPEAPKDILLNVRYEVLTRNEEVKQARPAR